MSRISTIALVSALVLTPAFALGAGVTGAVSGAANGTVSAAAGDVSAAASTDGNASASANDNGANVNASGSVSGQLSYDQLIGDINSGDASTTVTAIGAVNSSSTINIVPVSSLEGGANADASAMTTATASGSDRLGKIRSAVHANAAIEAALTAKGYTDDDVLSVQTDASANVWVYVSDKK